MAGCQQVAQQLDDPALAEPLGRREGHAQEVEFDARATTHDREVVLEDGVRIGVADHDASRVGALRLEDRELVQARPPT